MKKAGRAAEKNMSTVTGHLRNREEMAIYLDSCLRGADTDAGVVAQALGDVARATGMTKIAEATGLSRENLYKALSGERNPTLETFLKVLKASGLKLRIEPVIPPPRNRRRRPVRTVNIQNIDITFAPVSRKKYDELAAGSRPFMADDLCAERLRHFLDQQHPEFDAPRLYAALKNNFGESVAGYDAEACSFEYCFLLRIRNRNRTVRYLLRFSDRGNDFGIVFTRVGSPKYPEFAGDYEELQVISGEDLPEYAMREFVIWLVAFLIGYISACEKTFNKEFARSHKHRRIIYGFKNGAFFTDHLDEKDFAAACTAMAASGIPFNITC